MTIYDEIKKERKEQDAKWGGPAHDDEHIPAEWRRFIIYHANLPFMVGEKEDFRYQMVRVAALAVAAIESIDRKGR